MGFSVSASAAIIFISFLMVAGTLYTAWDNTYTNVQAAQEYWYEMRLSQLNTLSSLNAKNSSVSTGTDSSGNQYYNLTLAIQSNGVTLYVPHWSGTYDGKLITLYNIDDDNVGFLSDYGYLLPGNSVQLNVTYIPLDETKHTLKITFGNGCWVMFDWYYNTTNNVVYVNTSRGCPTEVS
ncbi:flagella [Thermococcus sp. 9N3]|uniref:flagella n=1 Tax=Thermococcus sp. 9N3 TaxID=163002 RepID=UPI001431F3B3|nr:flagella [Thermococcus sp. 9N3]NJE47989.1 flagella [Thermococcus sp. 9N3]